VIQIVGMAMLKHTNYVEGTLTFRGENHECTNSLEIRLHVGTSRVHNIAASVHLQSTKEKCTLSAVNKPHTNLWSTRVISSITDHWISKTRFTSVLIGMKELMSSQYWFKFI